jgi:transposase
MRVWCGIDWSTTLQDAAVVDAQGRTLARCRFRTNVPGVRDLLATIRGAGGTRSSTVIGIEDINGVLPQHLLRLGWDVRLVHPVASADFRRRRAASGAKSDKRDAEVLAEMVRLEPQSHRRTLPDSEPALEVRALARAHDDLARQRRVHTGHLRSYLNGFHPGGAGLGYAGSPLALTALALAPSPRAATSLRLATLIKALREAGVPHPELKADVALNMLRTPTLLYEPAAEAGLAASVLAQVAVLQVLMTEHAALEMRLRDAFAAHPQYPIYASFPGLGGVLGARVLAEIGDAPGRFATARALCAFAGTAPVTRSSGGHTSVCFRRVCDKRLRQALHLWVMPLCCGSPVARARYDARRTAGDRYAAAVRNVGNFYVKVLYKCLEQNVPYDEGRLVTAQSAGRAASSSSEGALLAMNAAVSA